MRTAIVAVYMGPLPAHFGLWLASCARNASIDWFVVSDQPVERLLPVNVQVVPHTLEQLRSIFSASVGFEVSLDQPYKLCDMRPLWYLLVPDFDAYDYWGWCDLDVIWGQLDRFIAVDAPRYDRLLSEGHLTVFRRDPETLLFYRRVDQPSWRTTLSTPAFGGLDEHHGINRVWAASNRPMLWDGARVADILPEFARFRTLPRYPNTRVQAFAWRDGRIVREYSSRGRLREQEYLYIHFQKRVMPVHVADDARDYFIGPDGFTRHPGRSPTRDELAVANLSARPTLVGLRTLLRDVRRRLRRDDPFRRVDRPRPSIMA